MIIKCTKESINKFLGKNLMEYAKIFIYQMLLM